MPTLEWIGKDKVINHHLDVPYRVLERKYSFDENGQHEEDNGSENMIIHGDNLDALKSLLPQYEGRVKCIYIDPPYNTAKSTEVSKKWVYTDNVDHPVIQAWIGKVVGDEGEDYSRHDKWLCMMYPRLKLLQRLLASNGVIFISIDDNEYSRLKDICDEIFGSTNYIKTFIWYTTGHTDNQDSITGVHEYILCYAKKRDKLEYNSIVDPNVDDTSKILRDFAENSITKNGPKNPPSTVILPKGFPCEVETLELDCFGNSESFLKAVTNQGYITRELTREYSVKYPVRLSAMHVENYSLCDECSVFSGWMNVEKLQRFIKNKCNPIEDNGTLLRFFLSKNGVIYYHRDGRESHYIQSVLENMGTTETNKYMLEKMGLKFDYPKPVELIEYLLSIFVKAGDIVLDSFAGSGTTAHAVLNICKQIPLHYILVELEDYAESSTAKRVEKVISGFDNEPGTGGDFSFYELGEPLMIGDNLNEDVGIDKIREYVFFTETKCRLPEVREDEPYYLGEHANNAYYFYYERDAITTLNRDFLRTVKTKADGYVIYADLCTLSEEERERHHITFKKIPRDITKL